MRQKQYYSKIKSFKMLHIKKIFSKGERERKAMCQEYEWPLEAENDPQLTASKSRISKEHSPVDSLNVALGDHVGYLA